MGILGIRNSGVQSIEPNKKRCVLKKKTELSEVELCDIVKKSNLFPGYKLHEEVGISGVSCDMVFENGEKVFCVEAKTELNFKVFAQACRWRNVATASYIAVPYGTIRDWFHNPKKVILEELGLGIIFVYEEGANFANGYNPFDFEKPLYCGANDGIYFFPADMEYWKTCFERIGENQTAAGSKMGKRSTTFSRTIEALKLEAKKHPEYTLDQLLVIVPTHYSNIKGAKQAIINYAKYGIIEEFWNTKQ